MARPRISQAVKWDEFEKAVHKVFLAALDRLRLLKRLPRTEPGLNLEVFHLALAAHQDQVVNGACVYHFTINPDSTSIPLPDDTAESSRLKKRPDFACTMRDMQAPHPSLSQITYYLECKRLGKPEGQLVFNDLYSEKGIARFIAEEHQYAKGCASGAMIGYIQDMAPPDVFVEVSQCAVQRSIPPLAAAPSWVANSVLVLPPVSLVRSFAQAPILLHHFWIDLRHCKFDVPTGHPPQSAGNPLPGSGCVKAGRRGRSVPDVVPERPSQRIAILGWGSLLWEQDAEFDAEHGPWQAGGPTLRIEFSRISTVKRPGALTLVIDEMNGAAMPVQWCLSRRASVAETAKDLRKREGTNARGIRVLRLDEPYGPFSVGSVEETVASWARQENLTAVVWTGLSSNFQQSVSAFSPAAAVMYLKGLPPARRRKAVEYIRRAPSFVQTAFRAAFEGDGSFG